MRDNDNARTNGHHEEQEDQPLRKKGRAHRNRRDIALSKTFHPRFLEDADQRIAVVRQINKQVEALMADAGGKESRQRAMLVKHTVFLHVLLETQETELAETGTIDLGSFTQSVNCLVGLLRMLGLEKRIKKVGDLQTYLEQKKEAQ